MSLPAELSYTIPPRNAIHRALLAFGTSRAGGWLFSKTLARVDRLVALATSGRHTLSDLAARLPVLLLITTGRQTGRSRACHVTAVPFRDKLALLGTNFGQRSTPAWALNLEAHPAAQVTYRGVSRRVVARAASAAEREQILAESAAVYTGYQKYQQRITGRRVRIFVLDLVR